MRKILTIMITFLTVTITCVAAPPPDDLILKLTKAIHNYCPEAVIVVNKQGLVVKDKTMIYTLHGQSKSGEFDPQTYQKEGPKFNGFILLISLYDGQYDGAAKVPQTLHGPYFPTYIDAPKGDDGEKHYQIHFSYGSGLNPELKKAIFEIIPKSKFQQSAPLDAK